MLSVYTQALVTALDSQGHVLDVVPLLEAVRANVCAVTGGVQTPCVYSAKAAPVRLVSLVGTVNLGTGVAVNDVVLPLVRAMEAQVCYVSRLGGATVHPNHSLGDITVKVYPFVAVCTSTLLADCCSSQ
jgi:hypothetical protein